MANEKTRVFGREGSLAGANEKGAACPSVGTTYELTGRFAVVQGWTDRAGKVHDEDRSYAFFEGKKNGKEVAKGLSAGLFLRRPFNGFPTDATLTDFQKQLVECNDAEDLYSVLEKAKCFDGKKIVVKNHISVNEIPFGGDKEKPVKYANFDVE